MGRAGVLMFAFGALDLFAFYRSFHGIVRMLENYMASIYPFLLVVLIVSLLASGPLIMMGNRLGYIIYYFQFPLKFTFMAALTVGFLLPLLDATTGTLYYGMLLATIYAVEAIRLMHTIQRHRNVR